MTKMLELRDLSDEQLQNRVDDIYEELFALKNELALQRKLERPHLLKTKKKEKARILTLLTERRKIAERDHGKK